MLFVRDNLQSPLLNMNRTTSSLKGLYEDYTWGYGGNPLDFTFHEFQLHLVPKYFIIRLAIGTFFV